MSRWTFSKKKWFQFSKQTFPSIWILNLNSGHALYIMQEVPILNTNKAIFFPTKSLIKTFFRKKHFQSIVANLIYYAWNSIKAVLIGMIRIIVDSKQSTYYFVLLDLDKSILYLPTTTYKKIVLFWNHSMPR